MSSELDLWSNQLFLGEGVSSQQVWVSLDALHQCLLLASTCLGGRC